ncbi:lipid IV(A) 3-deoxy-D-manno-octulosonic acid transferase [Pasteurella atlantica]|uniref:lipid IV(A) 3-deoxy-D-manno-octulosonic acid transferase n=1 Tax=Pasteurellaceae TaxID=712 RepID=UPI00274AD7DB|nr:lipid IV(A) 3-deoxy-D-manno-octulosonic acid transferase [Pasteurella atlantica]MDP8033289.1 lipid IV(A) 3-deoxy-D-manno-octulosonic acid transferase [Pasteurella atlantica]MDP8035161.1 lipid IV(A) 3-deoxy-D-manno-octulosonic acid transferase [Pasteurella atlantica]MDP8037111.1 lipid IV(A) 3-deoxy-D-manno-octulosonic acid transferase [Pasteurella atlantica]MDP8047298.1 lipid IV(A) 3-deoxy-D-manno-octulosonic acid transferase [Pasteurella atlantica]MDP8049478.1 lipid IV(A) 3-deoxy-D-manno-oc
MMLKCYTIMSYLLQPLILLEMLRRSIKQPAYRQRLGERYAIYNQQHKIKKNGLVIHAASVGEVIAITPLVKKLQKDYPNLPLTFTTVTPTGSERVKAAFGESVFHFYLPYDIPYFVKKFLNFVQPKAIIVVETELWPNLIYHTNQRNIPFIIANARLSPRSTKRYGYVKKLLRPMLDSITLIMAQDKTSADRYLELGIEEQYLINTGNLKFDLNVDEALHQQIIQLKHSLNVTQRPIWIAGSTHEGEDQLILNAHQELLKDYPDLILILVPRHPERFESVANIIKKTEMNFIRRSHQQSFTPEISILLGDTMGEMMLLYGLANIAFVGGSLIKQGGHNPLEPIAFKLPVISGVHTYNFTEIYEKLSYINGFIEIQSDTEALIQAVRSLLENTNYCKQIGDAGFQVLKENQGALKRHLSLLTPYLQEKTE